VLTWLARALSGGWALYNNNTGIVVSAPNPARKKIIFGSKVKNKR